MFTLYYLGEKLSGGVKNYPAADYLAGRERVGQKFEKKIREPSHSPEITLLQFLVHCETLPYPYTLTKTLS